MYKLSPAKTGFFQTREAVDLLGKRALWESRAARKNCDMSELLVPWQGAHHARFDSAVCESILEVLEAPND